MKNEEVLKLNGIKIKFVKLDNFYEIPLVINMSFVFLCVVAYCVQFFLLPSLIEKPYFLAVLLISLLLTITAAVLIHEAIHNLLHPNKKLNNFMGHVLSCFSGIGFNMQRYDHLQHHRYNATEKNSPDIKVLNNFDNLQIKYLLYIYNNVLGLFLREFWFSITIPFRREANIRRLRCLETSKRDLENSSHAAMRLLISQNKLFNTRIEGIIILTLHILSLYFYRDCLILCISLFLFRGAILNVLDSFAHYKTPANANVFAKNVSLPKFLEKHIFLNFNLHGVHHIYPSRPWCFLPQLMRDNDLGIEFIYHQSMSRALIEKFQKPRFVDQFPNDVIAFNDV